MPLFRTGWTSPAHAHSLQEVANLVRDYLPDSIILFYPTRILARKNIAFALQIVGALRDIGVQVRLLISGAPDTHNRSSTEHCRGPEAISRRSACPGIDKLGQRALLC